MQLKGKPSTVLSDNRTNFVGAERELAEYVAAWSKVVGIVERLIQLSIRSRFNPPAASY